MAALVKWFRGVIRNRISLIATPPTAFHSPNSCIIYDHRAVDSSQVSLFPHLSLHGGMGRVSPWPLSLPSEELCDPATLSGLCS